MSNRVTVFEGYASEGEKIELYRDYESDTFRLFINTDSVDFTPAIFEWMIAEASAFLSRDVVK